MLIVVDGAVDLPDALERSPMLRRVPGVVWSGQVAFEGDSDDFWAQLRRGWYPSTTPPTISALSAAYQHPGPVVAVHVSARLSATVKRAREAAMRATTRVAVVDTRSLSVGAGLVASAVHRAACHAGAPASIADYAASLPERVHTFALVQDVDALLRSGRTGLMPAQRLARNRPLVLAVRGRAVALGQARTRRDAIADLGWHLRQSTGTRWRTGTHGVGSWALGHGDAADVDAVAERLSEALGRPPDFCTEIDATVGAHLGPESLVVGVLTADASAVREG